MSPAGTRERLYLRTSPEFACKKLLAAGERRIVEFARSFRNRERGVLHHPEFTLVEWYRANEPYETLMDDCGAILALAAEAAGATPILVPGPGDRSVRRARTAGSRGGVRALRRHRSHGASAAGTCARVSPPRRRPQVSAPPPTITGATSSAACWSRRSNLVSGSAGRRSSTNIPPSQSPLAEPSLADPRLAERFELYACGVELANGFGELTDAGEQRTRLEQQMAEKERIYGERYPIDEEFLDAVAAMPPASGVALGFDRLVMLATGATHIEQVLWTPMSEN